MFITYFYLYYLNSVSICFLDFYLHTYILYSRGVALNELIKLNNYNMTHCRYIIYNKRCKGNIYTTLRPWKGHHLIVIIVGEWHESQSNELKKNEISFIRNLQSVN